MEVIWHGEAGDTSQTALRLIMNNDGLIMFQWRLAGSPEWTDVDDCNEVPTPRDFLFGQKAG
jgi:hypothetical protein